MTRTRAVLVAALLALAVVYAVWFARQADWIAVAVFALPPALLAWRCRAGAVRPAFWSGVFALFWFAHAVMVAWTRLPERGYALIALALATAVVVSASLPGLRARFSRPPRTAD